MVTVGLGDLIIFGLMGAVLFLLIGWLIGTGEGFKMARQDIRRLQRQLNGHKYQVGDIVMVDPEPDIEEASPFCATISRVYHLLDGDHDYELLLPGGKHLDVDEEDILRRVSKGVA